MSTIIRRNQPLDSLDDITQVTTSGSLAVATDGSRTYIQSTKAAEGSAWDVLGIYENNPFTIVSDIEATWDYKTDDATNKRFMMLFRNATGISFTGHTGIYHVDDNFKVWNGNTQSPDVEVLSSVVDTWYNCKAVFRNDGTVEYFIKLTTDTEYLFLARTETNRSYNYIGQGIRFATNHHTTDSSQGVDNLVYQIGDRQANLTTTNFYLKERY